MSWLSDNASWLFSGVGVAALGWLVWVVRRVVAKRQSGNLNKNTTVSDAIATPVVVATPPAAKVLTVGGIISTLRSSPLLQQPQVAANYTGIAVSWETELAGADRHEDGDVQLQLVHQSPDGRGTVFVNIKEATYPGLGLLRKGHSILVSGTIAQVNDHWITLDHATIQFEPS